MRTFEPDLHEDVEASHPHPPHTRYRVSIGREYWGDAIVRVEKVQMVYDGRVSGRRAPSYPADSDDWQRVMDALRRLREHAGSPPDFSERPREDTPGRILRPRLRDLMGTARGVYGSPEEVQKEREAWR